MFSVTFSGGLTTSDGVCRMWTRLGVAQPPLVGGRCAFAKLDLSLPAQRVDAGHLQNLAGGAVRLRRVEDDLAFVAHDLRQQRGQLAYGQVVSRPNIYRLRL